MQNPISLIRRLTHKDLPKGLAGVSIWLGLCFCILFLLREVTGGWGTFFGVLQIFTGIALVAVGLPLLWQFVRRRMLWSLRNKLVLTYLLIGLAPVVLVVTLVSISAYIAAGQFAIHLADSQLRTELAQMGAENQHRTDLIAQMLEGKIPTSEAMQDQELTGSIHNPRMKLRRETEAFVNGTPMQLGTESSASLGLPPWAMDLPGGGFQHLVSDGEDLYLVAIHQQRLQDGRKLSLLTSLLVDRAVMDMIAERLGKVRLQPPLEIISKEGREARDAVAAIGASGLSEKTGIAGGTEPPPANVADVRVAFKSTELLRDWTTGDWGNGYITVISRPSLLYHQLFGASLRGIVTSSIRVALILLCVIFALIELLALVMAIRLSRTITVSVADLYQATLQVDRGELNHQIVVTRQDQLAELSRSFNRMTGSLQRLLVEQKEKERLQSELSIAQEVQANLFPHHIHNLETLELHGVCRPARSVSGDYYDFLVCHGSGCDGQESQRETGVAIAIGDISGKGISAALLMASLHSAVRAYRFASEALIYSESSVAGLLASRDGRGGRHDELFESPGHILSLLNRHLFRSTQPEKYATLFLAYYDVATSMLTYSNAGQLPPLVLGRDGGVRRLDQGGTVVGLMDGMRYEEGRVKLQPGDIMVAYSDGVTEPENDFGEFGEVRLMEVVRRYRDQPLHVISSQVMQALDAWIGAEEQPDDITLVLARQV
jgi:sigma-B regulation protein RsbU (phosphoserine phosphatase)